MKERLFKPLHWIMLILISIDFIDTTYRITYGYFFLASSNNAFDNKLPCKSPETSPVLINIFLFIHSLQA